MNSLKTYECLGSRGEYFYAFESGSGGQGFASQALVIEPGASFVSLFLTDATGQNLTAPIGVSAELVAPDGARWGLSVLDKGQAKSPDEATICLDAPCGRVVYVGKPQPGEWRVEISASDAGPFSCEIRVMPEMDQESDAAARAFADFANALPDTVLISRLRHSGDAADMFCTQCRDVVQVAMIAIGAAALIVAAMFMVFGPAGQAIAIALLVLSIVMSATVIVDVLISFVDLLRGDPIRAIPSVSLVVCRIARQCP